ncbi:MAG: bacterial Ig-like domain-containing protein [Clostridia bacterium]|nr:bacterial Ig-like domain-containing protein [Clostridia bacterium]
MLLFFALSVFIPVMIQSSHAADVTPEIPIVSKVMTGIRVSSLPTKTKYYTGEYLDIKGARLTIEYSDGSTETVAVREEWCDGFESYTAGTSTVYVKYPEWSDPATFSVTVVYPKVTYITIKSKPDTTVYYTGQTLNTAGISVMATYDNGYIDDVSSDVTYSKIDFGVPAEKKNVTVTYTSDGKKFTASFDIRIIQRAPVSIRISSSSHSAASAT